jgi:hypothetical protein
MYVGYPSAVTNTAGIGGTGREASRSANRRGRNLRWCRIGFSVHWLPVHGIGTHGVLNSVRLYLK